MIFRNAIQTPDGTVLESESRWDCVSYKDKNGYNYSVDGGTSYLKRGFDKNDFNDISVTSDSPFEEIRKYMNWGTYGKDGKGDYRKVQLCNMSNLHIKAILETQTLSKEIGGFFFEELKYREKRNIFIDD